MSNLLDPVLQYTYGAPVDFLTSEEDLLPGLESSSAHGSSATLPENSPLVENRSTGLKIRFVFRKGTKRITLQRFLITKLVKYPGTVTLLELNAIYENMLWCLAKSEVDPVFKKKFGETLEVIKQTLIANRIGNQVRNIKVLSRKLGEKNLESFLYPERNLPQLQEKLKNTIFVLDGELGKPSKLFPPRRVIGKGYRDHGTLKDQAWDGSPSWQEVASTHIDVLEDINGTERPNSSSQKEDKDLPSD